MTDLVVGLGNKVPSSLASIKIAESPAAIAACTGLARSWRLRRDVRESYIAASQKVEQDFSLSKLDFRRQEDRCHRDLPGRRTGLAAARRRIAAEKATDDLLSLAKSRLASFWAEAMPSIQAHWALIAAVAEVLLEADRVEKSLKKPPTTVPALVKAYADGDSPWCLLDSHHRHMASRWFKFESSDDNGSLEKLVNKADRRYTQVGSELAKHFVTQFQKAKHPIKGRAAAGGFVRYARSSRRCRQSKTAYVWVDALRFEMARELAEVLKDDFDLSLQPAIGNDADDHRDRHGLAAAQGQPVGQSGVGRQRQARPGDRRDGHQGPQGPHQLHQGPRRGAGVRHASSTICSRSQSKKVRGRHPERSTRAGDIAGD